MAKLEIINANSWQQPLAGRGSVTSLSIPMPIIEHCTIEDGQIRKFEISFPPESNLDTIVQDFKITNLRFNIPSKHSDSILAAKEKIKDLFFTVKVLDMDSNESTLLKFKEEWPIERIKNITLEEYALGNPENYKESLSYWVETVTKQLGDIGGLGGGGSFKHGIFYKTDHKDYKNQYTKDDHYAWLIKYGTERSQAFDTTKKILNDVVEYASTNQFEKIDHIDFYEPVKWKWAFLFSENSLIPVFKKEALEIVAKEWGYSQQNSDYSSLYKFLISQKKNDESFIDLGERVWAVYKEKLPANYYIIGSKYGGSIDVFLQMHLKNVISTDYANGIDLHHFVGKPEKDIVSFLKEHNEDSSCSCLKKFLNIKPGDKVAIKGSGSPKGKQGFLSIVGIAEVVESEDYYSYEPNGLGHTIPVEWIAAPVYKEFNIGGYGQTLHKLSNKKHIHEIFDADYEEISPVSIQKSPLNQIFYGPPGTGKTYNTVNKALEICGVDIEGLDRNEVKERFDGLVDAGQIVFTTFHQSMTYEDFIEGIKPNIASEEEPVTYKINEGIFYRLAIEASFSIVEKSQSHSAKDVLDFSSAYDSYIELVSDRLDKSEDVDLKTKSGGTVYIDSISDHGNISIKHSGKEKTYVVSKTRLTKLNSAIGNLEGVTNINDTIRSIIGGCNSSAYWAVLNEIRKKKPQQDNHNQRPEKISFNDKKEAVKSFLKQDYQVITGRPYVLIIDEINRGNISEIFGELITLIEEDKRLGREEAIEVMLPYSKEKFGVPSNLYIIGTMNTADRSIEALDTALRRRFSFIEMLPDSDLIKTEGKLKDSDGKIDELDLPEVLNTINLRIEKLLDHDHTIGHSYLLSVESLDDLKKVFHNKIIPLLQEYFFGDTGKIGLIIGKGFFEDKGEQPKFDKNFFADFDDYDTDALMDKKVYHLINVEELSDDTFVEALYCLLNKKPSAS